VLIDNECGLSYREHSRASSECPRDYRVRPSLRVVGTLRTEDHCPAIGDHLVHIQLIFAACDGLLR
jgi:hypothetical protein